MAHPRARSAGRGDRLGATPATDARSSSSTSASAVRPVNCAPLDLGVRTVAVMEAAWQSVHSGGLVRVADLPGERSACRRRAALARAAARPAPRRLRPPDARRDRVRALRAGDVRDRARAGRAPGRPLRRRHRRHRRAGDHGAARSGRGGHRGRPVRDPAQLEPHAPLRDRGLLGRRADRAAGARARRSDQELRRRRPGQGRLGLRARVRAARAGPAGVGGRLRRARRQPARARRRRHDDPGLEPRRARRQPGHLAPAPSAGRERRRHGGQLRLPPCHDRLRPVRLLGRLPGAVAGGAAAEHGRRGRLPPGRGRQRPAEGRLHRQRGRGGADGRAPRDRGAPLARRPLRPGHAG